jgi:hypothetical protein
MSSIRRVKIVTGWSNPGGSTVAHINLCNLFNSSGIDCTLYGPHEWHMGKCDSATHNSYREEEGDVIISHFCTLNPKRLKEYKCRHILSCHETNMFPLKQMDLEAYDVIHYVSNHQKKWHSVNHPNVIISNVVEDLKPSPLGTGACGIIGSVDIHKQTHVSIERAIWDGWDKIFIFGLLTDVPYAREYLEPLIEKHKGKIHYQGHVDNKQKMYDSIDAVYHSSKRETFNYIKHECDKTGVSYRGLDTADCGSQAIDNKDIFELWKQTIENIV